MERNILLIGGSHGIGSAMARILQEHSRVYVASRTMDEPLGPNVIHLPFDVSSDDLLGLNLPDTLDGFAYCPGSIDLKPFKRVSMESLRAEMEVNFFGLFKTAQAVMPRMSENSAMVFFSTIAVSTGMPFHSGIASAKGAIEGLTRSLAAEYAPRVRVNAVAPSLVDTPLAERLLNNEKKRELMAARHPLKRYGTAEDIARLAVFLLGPESGWITGQVIGIDGGLSTLNVGG